MTIIPNPQQPELRRDERGATIDDAAKQIPEKTRLKGRPQGTDKGTKGTSEGRARNHQGKAHPTQTEPGPGRVGRHRRGRP